MEPIGALLMPYFFFPEPGYFTFELTFIGV